MLVQPNPIFKRLILVASVAALIVVVAVALHGISGTEKLSQLPDAEVDKQNKQQQFVQMNNMDRKTMAIMEKADSLTKQADLLIAKTDLQKPTARKQTAQSDKNITTRLADVRSRLDALKK